MHCRATRAGRQGQRVRDVSPTTDRHSAGISKAGRHYGVDPWGEYWRFTSDSARRLFAEASPGGSICVEAHGNVSAAIAFLHGLAAAELTPAELDYRRPDFEVVIAVRAVKAPQA